MALPRAPRHVAAMYPQPAPPVVVAGIPTIALVLAALFVLAQRAASRRSRAPPRAVRQHTALAAVAVASWLAAFGIAAGSGLLARFDARPPPLALAMLAVVAGALAYSLSAPARCVAQSLPLAALVGFQVFRLPLELVLHEAAGAGVMPPQMTYTGWNFDVVTGATAPLLAMALLVTEVPGWLVLAWNAMGIILVSVVMTIGIVSTPMLHAFGPGAVNAWIAYFPFVWLPAVMVPAAIIGHVLVFRHLAGEPTPSTTPG